MLCLQLAVHDTLAGHKSKLVSCNQHFKKQNRVRISVLNVVRVLFSKIGSNFVCACVCVCFMGLMEHVFLAVGYSQNSLKATVSGSTKPTKKNVLQMND